MQHIQGGDRNQTLLLPVAVDDYVGRENPVRFIEAFIDQCDLQEAGFRRVQPQDTGRPGDDPADLLKLYIYGYVNRVRSSRRLEAETTRNLEVIWLLRGLRPDFKTRIFARTTDTPSSPSSVNSCSSAANWSCSDENCWPSTGPG
jgi:transposase